MSGQLTAFTPSGNPHLGNYLGTMRPIIAGRIVTIEISETVLRVYDERGDTLINQLPRTSTKPLARFKAYGVNHNRNTG